MSESDNFQIIKYSPEYKEQFLELQTFLWGNDIELNRAYFEWKYEQSPYQSEPIIYMIVCDGKVVSVAGYNNSHWQTGNPACVANCLSGCDAITHPEYRRRGFFTKIGMKFLEDYSEGPYDYIFTLSAGAVSTPASHKFGWFDLAPNEVGICFPNAIRREPGKFREILKGIPAVYSVYRFLKDRIQTKEKREDPSSEDITQEQFPQFHFLDEYFSNPTKSIWMANKPDIAKMVELVSKTSANEKIRQVRDETFFSWRYRNPRANYRFLYSEHDQLDGYLVIRESKSSNAKEVQIVDWEIADLSVMRSLFEVVIFQGKFNAITIWTPTLSEPEKQLLRELHFSIDLERTSKDTEALRPCVMIKQLATEHPDDWLFTKSYVADVSNWDIRSIYSDGM